MITAIVVLSILVVILFLCLISGSNKYRLGVLAHKSIEKNSSLDMIPYFHVLVSKENTQEVCKIRVTDLAYSKFNNGDFVIIRE